MKTIRNLFSHLRVTMEHRPRYNIAPSQEAPIVRQTANQLDLVPMVWGLVPAWSKEKNKGLINARSETVHEKPSFRDAFKNRRCLVPADGFIEWQKAGSNKIPHYFRLKSEGLFAFAGIWSERPGDTAPHLTYSILTTECNTLVQPTHHRMPVILPPENYAAWLNDLTGPEALKALLHPFPAAEMESFVLSQEINSAKNDHPSCLLPV